MGDWFSINLMTVAGENAFHFDCRNHTAGREAGRTGYICRNAHGTNGWGAEERLGASPFADPNVPFSVEFLMTESQWKVKINDCPRPEFDFNHRLRGNPVNNVQMGGRPLLNARV